MPLAESSNSMAQSRRRFWLAKGKLCLRYLLWPILIAAGSTGLIYSFHQKFYVGRASVLFLFTKQTPEWHLQEASLITSPETLLHVVEAHHLLNRWRLSEPEEAVIKLAQMTEVTRDPDTGILFISVFSEDMHESAELANAIFVAYGDRRNAYDSHLGRVRAAALETLVTTLTQSADEAKTTLEGLKAKLNESPTSRDSAYLLAKQEYEKRLRLRDTEVEELQHQHFFIGQRSHPFHKNEEAYPDPNKIYRFRNHLDYTVPIGTFILSLVATGYRQRSKSPRGSKPSFSS